MSAHRKSRVSRLHRFYLRLLETLRDLLRARSHRYRDLFHGDDSLYMERAWLLPRFMLQEVEDEYGRYFKPRDWMPFSLRLHGIATHDMDRHFHDHPWWFCSFVLSGGYIEARPAKRAPCFWPDKDEEMSVRSFRGPGDLAFRHATDRHRIIYVLPNTWTLVLHGRVAQWWGFYMRRGKVYYRDYPSVHHANAIEPRSER